MPWSTPTSTPRPSSRRSRSCSYGLLGFWLCSLALRRAAVTAVNAPLILLETLIPAVIGIAVFDDEVRAGWWPVAVIGFALSTAGALVLCGAEARLERPRAGPAASSRQPRPGWMGRMTAPSADVSARVAWADDAPAIAAVQVRAWRTSYADLLPAEVLDGLRRRRHRRRLARGPRPAPPTPATGCSSPSSATWSPASW